MIHMEDNCNLYYISGFEPGDFDAYIQACLPALPEGFDDCVKYAVMDPAPGVEFDAWAYVAGESMNGVNIRVLAAADAAPRMRVYIPWAASGMDVHLAFAFLNAVKKAHPDALITSSDTDGRFVFENEAAIDDEARDEVFSQRLDVFAMFLEMSEPYVKIPTMDGEWKMDLRRYRKELAGLPVEEKLNRVLYDIIDWIWYREG